MGRITIMLTILLALLYPIAIQYERKGLWYGVLPITAIAWVIDILANYSELALLTWDVPLKGEWTFSDRLVRLRKSPTWRGPICQKVADILNYIAPSGKHIL